MRAFFKPWRLAPKKRILLCLANPFCADPGAVDCAAGGAAYFKNGLIVQETPAGKSDILIVEV